VLSRWHQLPQCGATRHETSSLVFPRRQFDPPIYNIWKQQEKTGPLPMSLCRHRCDIRLNQTLVMMGTYRVRRGYAICARTGPLLVNPQQSAAGCGGFGANLSGSDNRNNIAIPAAPLPEPHFPFCRECRELLRQHRFLLGQADFRKHRRL
jgi:hypothetical protein